jgi:hypothetical protein
METSVAKAKKAKPPLKMSSTDLCKALAGIAAFHVEDEAAQMKIYEAIRRLQIMEKAAIDAGLLSK